MNLLLFHCVHELHRTLKLPQIERAQIEREISFHRRLHMNCNYM